MFEGRWVALISLMLLAAACGKEAPRQSTTGLLRQAIGPCNSDADCPCNYDCVTVTNTCTVRAGSRGDGSPCTLDPGAGHCYSGNCYACYNLTTGQGGAATPTPPPICNDNKACTDDTCDPSGDGLCHNTPNCNSPPICHTSAGASCSTSGCYYPMVAAGTICGTNMICYSGNCNSGCFIGTVYRTAGTTNGSCQVCDPAVSTSAWSAGNEALPSTCPSGQVCHLGSCISGCGIGGTYYDAGTFTEGGCRQCVPANSTSAWTNTAPSTPCTDDSNSCTADFCNSGFCTHPNQPDGTGCGAGKACSAGVCTTGCFIGGVYYDAGTVTSGGCQSCAAGSTSWTPAPNLTPCASDSLDCTVDLCNAVGICTHNNLTEGTVCDAGAICNGSACAPGCNIGNIFFAADTLSGGGCQRCDPSKSTGTWTLVDAGAACPDEGNSCTDDICDGLGTCNRVPKANGTSCVDGGFCQNGGCNGTCSIGGVGSQPNGYVNPANSCLVCDVASSLYSWTGHPQGTSCATGNPCTVGTCDGTTECVSADQPEGMPCDAGSICHSGNCSAGCVLDGGFLAPDASSPVNDCVRCQPAKSTTGMTPADDGAPCLDDGNPCTVDACLAITCSHAPLPKGSPCGANGFCDGEQTPACVNGCYIAGEVVDPGEADPANPCRVCVPDISKTGYSNAESGASCPADSNACTADVCDGDGGCGHPIIPNGGSCGSNGQKCSDGVCGCPGTAPETSCTDAVDDDCDGEIDCADSDCLGRACDDLDLCTTGEVCGAMACAGGASLSCDSPPECRLQGSCAADAGVCSYPLAAAGASCTDDGNPCTADTCSAEGLCQHPAIASCGGSGAGIDGGTAPEKPSNPLQGPSVFGCSSVSGVSLAALLAVGALLWRPRRRVAMLAVAGLLASPSLSGAEGAPPTLKIALLSLEAGPGVDAKTASFVTEALGSAIQQRPGVRVITPNDVRAALGFERQRQLIGCNDTSCLAEIGDALGVDKLVAGSLGRLGGSVAVNLQLIGAKTSAVERRYSARLKGGTEETFLDDLPNWVESLFPADSFEGAPQASRRSYGRWAVSLRGQLEAASRFGGAAALLGGAQLSERFRVSAGALLGGSKPGVLVSLAMVPFNAGGRVRPVIGVEALSLFTGPTSLGAGASVGLELALVEGWLFGLSVPAWWLLASPAGSKQLYVFGSGSVTARF